MHMKYEPRLVCDGSEAAKGVKTLKIMIQWQVVRDSDGLYNLGIRDVEAGVHLLGARMTAEEFARAVTGTSVEVECELRGLSKIGKVRETTNVAVLDALLRHYPETEFRDSLSVAVTPFEVDGWKAEIDSRYNNYRHNSKDQTYVVTLQRWVERKDET